MKTILASKLQTTIFGILFLFFFAIMLFAQNWVWLQLYGSPKMSPKTLDQMIDAGAAEYGLDPNLIRAVVRVESSDGLFLNAFEPHVYNRTTGRMSDFERRALSSSHGVMHVMGFNAKKCGIEWWELYDAQKGLACGIAYLKDCMKRHKNDVTKALGCYNGDAEIYPKKVKIAYADISLKKRS